jgi:hypothetical protein
MMGKDMDKDHSYLIVNSYQTIKLSQVRQVATVITYTTKMTVPSFIKNLKLLEPEESKMYIIIIPRLEKDAINP